MGKHEVRAAFRNAVFLRDKNKCRKCDKPAVDAHHIVDRHLMLKGGYVAENGISLCSKCHEQAEIFHRSNGMKLVAGFTPNDLFNIIGSSRENAEEACKRL